MEDLSPEQSAHESEARLGGWRSLVNLREGLSIVLGAVLAAAVYLSFAYEKHWGVILAVASGYLLVTCVIARKMQKKEQRHNAELDKRIQQRLMDQHDKAMDFIFLDVLTLEWNETNHKFTVRVSFRSASINGHVVRNRQAPVGCDAKLWVLLQVGEGSAVSDHVLGAPFGIDSVEVPGRCRGGEPCVVVFTKVDLAFSVKSRRAPWCVVHMDATVRNEDYRGRLDVVRGSND